MTDELTTDQYEAEGRLHEAIASFEQARDAGRDPKPQEWLGRYPEVAPQLAGFFADQEHLHRLVGPLRLDASRVALVPGVEPETFPEVPGYQVLEVIGWGGMGVVYKARQLSADRIVALKVIRPDRLEGLSPGERRKAIERFITEAQAAGQLEHENIVHVYEVGEARSRPFYSMRYVEGMSLHDLIQQGPLEGRRAAGYLEKVARAVHEAHRHGILHRDLKPHNILVEANGDRPLVADFGLAKLMQGGREVTGTGDVMGTPPYMSPEQARSSTQLTVATDVYGLGATLYSLLTGRPPFQGDDPISTLRKVVETEPPRPRTLSPYVHPDLETICLKCLEKQPQKRYSGAEELANRLAMFLENKPIPDRPINWLNRAAKWVRRRPAAAGLIGASGLALLFFMGFVASSFYLSQREKVLALTTQAKKQAEERARTEEQLRNKADKLLYLNHVLLAQNEWQDNNLIRARQLLDQCPENLRNWEWSYLRRLCDSASVTFSNAPTSTPMQFTADGKCLAAASNDMLTVWDSHTGQMLHTWAVDKDQYQHACFSPDGKRLARMGYNIIKVWDTNSGEEVFAHQGAVSFLRFSPDGKRLAWAIGDTVEVWDLETHQRTCSQQIWSGQKQCLALSPNGQRLVTVSKNGGDDMVIAKVWDLSASKEAFSLQGDIRFYSKDICYSPDGKYLVCSSGNGLRVWNAQSGELLWTLPDEGGGPMAWSFDGRYLAGGRKIVKVWMIATRQELWSFKGHTAGLRSVAFSPDGDRLVSTADDAVRIWDLRTDTRVQEATSLQATGRIAAVSFSPDGRYVATACFDKVVQVWDLHSPSLQPAFALRGHTDRVECVAFSPDGQQLASGSFDGTVKLWDSQIARETTTLRAGAGISSLAFTPDGTRLATTLADQTVRIWNPQTGQNFVLPGHAIHVAFNRDGTKLVGGGGNRTVVVWDTTTWRLVQNLPGHSLAISKVSFSPSGKLIASASFDRSVKLWDDETGQLLFTLEGHTEAVNGLAFSPDGKRLASAGADGTRVWDVGLGEQALAFKGFFSGVAFSPDGRRLAGASNGDWTVRIWDATSPQDKQLEFPQPFHLRKPR
jgi:WD40 repeat protein/predicted Ser/Thr protein kinase